MASRAIDLEEAVQRLQRTPMFDAVRELIAIQEQILASAPNPVDLIIAGGAAVHYWTRGRTSTDIDGEFSKKLVITDEHFLYKDEKGETQALYFDRNFSPSLATMHDGYGERAVRVSEWEAGQNIRVFVLAPVDLAISKLGRFQAHDRQDIKSLAAFGLLDIEQFKILAGEAIDYYVGSKGPLPYNLEQAIRDIEAADPSQRPKIQEDGDEPTFSSH